MDGVLYFDGGDRPDHRGLVVPKHLQKQIIKLMNIMMLLLLVISQ